MVAKLRAWLIALVREAVKAELLAITARTFIPVEPVAQVASKPISPKPVMPESFESMQEAAIQQCEVQQ